METPLINEAPSLLAAFAGGILSTLTPCVYPLIPITLSIVGAGREAARPRAFIRAVLYCFGIFTCYSLLGIAAVISGSIFGELWSSPYFRPLLGAVISVYALISLDLFNIRSEGVLARAVTGFSGNSSLGAFATGAVSGVLAAPCTGALLATILTFAASTSEPATGIMLLIAYAAGFSLPFFILSLSPAAFSMMPKSGVWLYGAKIAIGASLLALGFYYMLTGFSFSDFLWLSSWWLFAVPASLIALLAGVKYGILSYLSENKMQRVLSSFSAASAVLVILFLLWQPAERRNSLSGELEEQFLKAEISNKIVLIDFTAEWCVKCRELSETVLSDENVKSALSDLSTIIVDLSEVSDFEKELQGRFKVRGLPSMIFVCPSGERMEIGRLADVISVSEFLEFINYIKSKKSECV